MACAKALLRNTLIASASLGTLMLPTGAQAWQILSALKTDPCHERITLGSLAAFPAPWGLADPKQSQEALQTMLEKLHEVGFPNDSGTRAFLKDTGKRYELPASSNDQSLLYASFIAGSRDPDSDGFALLRLREARMVHLKDENQSPHFLRSGGQDWDLGNREAVLEGRKKIQDKIEEAWKAWNHVTPTVDTGRWTFPFYGEKVTVFMFMPAFFLGVAMHTAQDAFTHTIMDDSFRILSVGNYTDVMKGNYDEARDGPAHSDRMDHCNIRTSSFDAMRYTQAMKVSLRILQVALDAFKTPNFPAQDVEKALEEILPFRENCGYESNYCNSSWLPYVRRNKTKPISLLEACSANGASETAITADRDESARTVAVSLLLECGLWVSLFVGLRFILKRAYKSS